MGQVIHMERCASAEPVRRFFTWWNVHGLFPIVLLTGKRDDALQLVDYAKGRKQLPDGSWVVVDASAVETNAQTADQSAHGHDAANDFAPVRELLPNGLVKSIYIGDPKKEDPEIYAEALRRYRIVIDIATKQFDLESGETYPFVDRDHLCDKKWRELPLAA